MNKQRGFTLVEIAIVLVIIGLLLGGILKGQELINSARVRNLADTSTGVQAAYYGFIDRYRRIPGDWNNSGATAAIGIAIADGGNDDGQIEDASVSWVESNAMWVQLAAAGFIQGSYAGGNVAPTNDNGVSPLNAFNNVMAMTRTADFFEAPSSRLHLIVGRGIPVDVMRELDQKVDDSNPSTGDLRGTNTDTDTATIGVIGQQDDLCATVTGLPRTHLWNVTADAQSCNAAYLF